MPDGMRAATGGAEATVDIDTLRQASARPNRANSTGLCISEVATRFLRRPQQSNEAVDATLRNKGCDPKHARDRRKRRNLMRFVGPCLAHCGLLLVRSGRLAATVSWYVLCPAVWTRSYCIFRQELNPVSALTQCHFALPASAPNAFSELVTRSWHQPLLIVVRSPCAES